MNLYIYLNHLDHVDAWIKGGLIPIKPASSYKSDDRSGVFTPDETITLDSSKELEAVRGMKLDVSNGGSIKNVVVVNSANDPRYLPNFQLSEYSHWDGWIMCFCLTQSAAIARRFKGKAACIQILDIEKLKTVLDRQLGSISRGGKCEYTRDHRRHEFLKSHKDRWQAEYRFYWHCLGAKEVEVELPPNMAKLVATY